MTATLELFQQVLSENLGLPTQQLRLETRLEDLGVDSLTFLEMTFALEKELGIRFPEDAARIRTVGDVVTVVDRLRAPGA